MKKLMIIAAILIFGYSANAVANTNYSKRAGGYFYADLSHYGTWLEIDDGTIVWRPTTIRRNWSPYSRGQWLWTDYGWYWDSYEPFGHIVFHYGRWYYDDYYGWIWFPDDEWAPAWVDWRYDDDYIGWAPLSPYALFSINIGIHYNHNYYVPYNRWNYVNYNHFCDYNVYNYYVAPKYKYRVHNRTKMRTNYSYYDGRVRNDGVDFDRIRDRSGRSIEKRNLLTVNDPREISRDRESKNRDGAIRTYIAKREDLSRDNLRDIKINRSDRKTSLDLSKIELGRNRNVDRSRNTDSKKDDNREVIRKDRENTTIEKRNRTEDTRNEVKKDVTRDRVERDIKVQDRNDVQKRNSEIEKRNNEQIKRNEEIKRSEDLKRNELNKRNEQIELQKRSNEESRKRNEVINQNREVKRNPEVKQNSERKNEQTQQTQRTEQRTERYTSVNRNTEVKRIDSNNTTEKKNNSNRSSEDKNKTRSRR